jgi:HEAT repeat protein
MAIQSNNCKPLSEIEKLIKESDKHKRAAISRVILPQNDFENSIKILNELLLHEDEAVRLKAIEVLISIGTSEANKTLEKYRNRLRFKNRPLKIYG